MSSELFTIFAETSNAAYVVSATTLTSGVMCLASNMWSGYVSGVRIPKGCAMKIWESKVYSNTHEATVHIQIAMSGTGTVFKTLETDTVDSSGSEQRTSRSGRPIVIESPDGERLVRFYYITPAATTTSGMVFGSYNVEIVELEEA
jgi:hypothetical protein